MAIKIIWNHANHRTFAPFAKDVQSIDDVIKLLTAIRDHNASDPLERLVVELAPPYGHLK